MFISLARAPILPIGIFVFAEILYAFAQVSFPSLFKEFFI